MVDRTVIPQASVLLSYYRDVVRALGVIDQGATITAFTLAIVATNEDGMTTMSDDDHQATVSAEGIASPPQMMTAIRQQLETRRDAVNRELADLGVTT